MVKLYSSKKPKITVRKRTQWIFYFLLGALLGLIAAAAWIHKNKASSRIYKKRQSGYQLINPLLKHNLSVGGYTKDLEDLKYEINAFANSKINAKEANHISVYFRDLNNGPWFGIKEEELFAPASLLKVPIMIGWLKKAESDPQILKKKIKYENIISDIPQDIEPKESIKIGGSYTTEDLIYRMIAYSDNEAKNLLLLNIDEESLNKVYSDLGIVIPDVKTPDNFMSVKSYASFFRILYNASYLDKGMSEFALRLLSEDDFDGGLRAGLPKGTLLANKFGERESNEGKQLHDCGIIYYKGHPYILCVMTRGDDLKQLSGIIKDISRLVYARIDSEYRR